MCPVSTIELAVVTALMFSSLGSDHTVRSRSVSEDSPTCAPNECPILARRQEDIVPTIATILFTPFYSEAIADASKLHHGQHKNATENAGGTDKDKHNIVRGRGIGRHSKEN